MENAEQYVGGGNRELSEGEAADTAKRIAQSSADYERWAESRSLEERIRPATATVTTDEGETSEVQHRMIDNPTSVPDGFGGTEATEEDEDE